MDEGQGFWVRLFGRGRSPTDFLAARAHFGQGLPMGPLAAQDYVVFDLETTGLRPSRGDAIVQVGAVRLRGIEEVACLTTLVNPARPIPPESTRFHGIDDARVAAAPGMAAAIGAFRDFAAGAVLVAHNAAFDRTALHMAEFRGAPALPNAVLCSMIVSRWLDPAEADHSLDGLCGRRGIVIAGRHDALGDARATAALWVDLLARAAVRGVEHLPELVRRTRMGARMAESMTYF